MVHGSGRAGPHGDEHVMWSRKYADHRKRVTHSTMTPHAQVFLCRCSMIYGEDWVYGTAYLSATICHAVGKKKFTKADQGAQNTIALGRLVIYAVG